MNYVPRLSLFFLYHEICLPNAAQKVMISYSYLLKERHKVLFFKKKAKKKRLSVVDQLILCKELHVY